MIGANVIYNGIAIAIIKTNNIKATPVMSEDGVDFLWTKYEIDVNGIINATQTSYMNVNGQAVFVPGILPSVTYQAIRQLLELNRGTLQVFSNGSQLFLTPSAGSVTDADNGPKPISLTITRLDGNQLYHINYVIEINIAECPGNPDQYTALISNRFTQVNSIDGQFLTTSMTYGEAYFRVDILNDAQQVADIFRSLIVPPLPLGFKRVGATFKLNSKNNLIIYEIRDQESCYDLGDTNQNQTFVTWADGVFQMATLSDANGIPGAMSLATMTMKLKGSKQASVWNLTQYAFQLISQKIPIVPNLGQNSFGFLRNFQIMQSVTERFVDVTVSVQLAPVKTGPNLIPSVNYQPLQIDNIFPANGTGINPALPSDGGSRGTAALVMAQTLLSQVCQPVENSPGPLSATGTGGQATPQNQVPVIVTPTEIIPPSNYRYTPSTTQYPYTEARVHEKYDSDSGVRQAPISANSSSLTPPFPSQSPTPTSSQSGIQTSSFINIHQSITTRFVEWTAERVGQTPQIPEYNSSDDNQVLLRWNISPVSVEVAYDGATPIYRVSGWYSFGLKVDMSQIQQIAFSVPQWVDYNYGDASLNLADGGNTTPGLIDPGTAN
jgi:hypothetical protein